MPDCRRFFWPFLALIVLFTGCQSSGPGRVNWNPFRRDSTAQTSAQQTPQVPDSALVAAQTAERDIGRSPAWPVPVAEQNVERLVAEGHRALQEDRLEDARRIYEEILSVSPENATAHHGLAMTSDLLQRWTDAEYHYRQALRIRPRDASLLCDIGYSYLLQNRYTEASRYLNHAVEINPSHENAQINLALLDIKQGNRVAAEQRLSQRIHPDSVMQVMSLLEAQAAGGRDSSTTSHIAEASPTRTASMPGNGTEIPHNATFTEIKDLARQKKLEAEQQRASRNIPAEERLAQWPGQLMPHQTADSRNSGPWDSANGSPISAPLAGSAHTQMSNPAFAASDNRPVSVLPDHLKQHLPATGSPSLQWPAHSDHPMSAPSAASVPPSSAPAPFGNSIGAYQNLQQSGGIPEGYPSTSAGIAAPGLSSQGYGAPGAVPEAATVPGRVVPVYPSGAFEQPAHSQGVSYGQPLGWNNQYPPMPGNTPSAEMMQHRTMQASHSTGMQNTYGAQGTMNPGNGYSAGHVAPGPMPHGGMVQQSSAVPPAHAAMLEGVNAGPGGLFPVGQSPEINMNPIAGPGAYSGVNGRYYGHPQSVLSAQDHSDPQARLLRAQQQQSDQWTGKNNGFTPNHPAAVPGMTGNSPRASVSPWPPESGAPANSLESYERQRQQLNQEYNRALQQFDRGNFGGLQ